MSLNFNFLKELKILIILTALINTIIYLNAKIQINL